MKLLRSRDIYLVQAMTFSQFLLDNFNTVKQHWKGDLSNNQLQAQIKKVRSFLA